jgi:hypothetical protein
MAASLPVVVVVSPEESLDEAPKVVRVYLSRRNLDTLLGKLDVNLVNPGTSACTLVKNDVENTRYPQSHPEIWVTAVEDRDYYWDRTPGNVIRFPTTH